MGAEAGSRKALRDCYRERPVIGGVGAVKNLVTGRMLIESATDIAAKKNRFGFSASSGICIYPALKADWDRYGAGSFAYEVLETLVKPQDRSMKDFEDDVKVLESIYLSGAEPGSLY